MPPSKRKRPFEFDHALVPAGLLAALREAGMVVGIREELQLAAVFQRMPAVDGADQLASILRAVLTKNAEDRACFDRVFAGWLEDADAAVKQSTRRPRPPATPADSQQGGSRSSPESSVGGKVLAPPKPIAQKRILAAVAAAVAITVAIVGVIATGIAIDRWLGPDDAIDVTDAGIAVDAGTIDAGQAGNGTDTDAGLRPSACAPAALRNHTFTAAMPQLRVTNTPPPRPSVVLPLVLMALGLATAGVLWLGLRRRHVLALDDQPPASPTVPRQVLLVPSASEVPPLLSPHDRETMIWGIDRFLSDEVTRRLDVPATVRAIARSGGLPHIHFERARYHRNVWLWVDELCEDPAAARMAAEIASTLRGAGLPVACASFRGIADNLVMDDGDTFPVRELEEFRHGAVVAVLTDGAAMADYYPNQSARIHTMVRNLAHWPRLAVVDFAAPSQPNLLVRLAREQQIDVVAPAALAAYLGATERPHWRGKDDGPADAWSMTPWAAVCALCPAPVHAGTARALHRYLKLPMPVWTLPSLAADAATSAERLVWPEDQRLRYLAWLRESQTQMDNAAAAANIAAESGQPRSLLAQALDFWTVRYRAAVRCYPANSAELAQLHLEKALIAIWHDPDAGAETLYRLYHGRMRTVIARHLNNLVPADASPQTEADRARLQGPSGPRVRMLWRSQDVPRAYVILRSMGFDPDAPRRSLRRPARLWMGVSACAAAAVGAGLALLQALTVSPPPCQAPEVEAAAGVWADAVLDDDGQCHVTVATAQTQASLVVVPGAAVAADWRDDDLDCVRNLPGGTLWRCGAEDRRPPASVGQRRRVTIVDARDAADAARVWQPRDLALALLDCAQADMVYVGSEAGWAVDRVDALGASAVGEEVRVVAGDAWLSELHRLHGSGQDGKGCGSGVTMVEIPGGAFWMGTRNEDKDPMAYSDEQPARRVAVSDFAIGMCEVSNRQYRAYLEAARPEGGGDNDDTLLAPEHWTNTRDNQPDQPVVGVTWFQAQAFCQHFGYELPTEAEWEYACRGPNPDVAENRLWPFAGGEANLETYAWYGKRDRSTAAPTGTKDPFGYGLYDMLGNVYEWNADWYGKYQPATESSKVNPIGSESASRRLLRGGSFLNRARVTRCAYRFRSRPDGGVRNDGFRCVRGSGRQP